MKELFFMLVTLTILTTFGCAMPSKDETRYEASCRTHATKATYSGSPDVQQRYLECLYREGVHEVEIKELHPLR